MSRYFCFTSSRLKEIKWKIAELKSEIENRKALIQALKDLVGKFLARHC